MENIQRLMRCYLAFMAFFFIASTAYLQAQGPAYRGGDLTIRTNSDIPRNVASITEIDGDLLITGVSNFPNFADLESVTGDITIRNLHRSLTALNRVFTSLTTVGGILLIWDNDDLRTISGFNALKTVTGGLEIGNYRRTGTFNVRRESAFNVFAFFFVAYGRW